MRATISRRFTPPQRGFSALETFDVRASETAETLKGYEDKHAPRSTP
ncbi:MAG: hypothetical protein ACLUI3_01470 [Christensenellales bacterium]